MGHPQDHLSVKTIPTKVALRASGLLLLYFGLAACPAALGQADGTEMAQKLRQNTVRVSAGEDGSGEDGFGFITGERDGFLYIATAKHVLGKDTPNSPMSKEAKVSFFSRQGESFDAEVLTTFEGDLAVLKVKKPAGFDWIKACLGSVDAEKLIGTNVWFVGRQQKWFVPPAPGKIASEQVSDKWEVEIYNLGALPGTSGAPLIASTGIIGMIRTDAADSTRAVVIERIEHAFKGWNHPWDLTRTTAPVVALNASSTASATTNVTSPPSSARSLPEEAGLRLEIQNIKQATPNVAPVQPRWNGEPVWCDTAVFDLLVAHNRTVPDPILVNDLGIHMERVASRLPDSVDCSIDTLNSKPFGIVVVNQYAFDVWATGLSGRFIKSGRPDDARSVNPDSLLQVGSEKLAITLQPNEVATPFNMSVHAHAPGLYRVWFTASYDESGPHKARSQSFLLAE